jgi:hypothetical protein
MEIIVRALLWCVCLKTLKRDLMETMELTPSKLRTLCELDWLTFGVGWLLVNKQNCSQ